MSHRDLSDLVEHLDCAAHHGGLREGSPTMLIMHASESDDDAARTIAYLNTTDEKQASYHYLIDRDGSIKRMTSPNIIAYHCGDSAWPAPKRARDENDKPNRASLNRISVGIAWENNARNTGEQLTVEQIESGLWLCGVFIDQYGIPVARVRGHGEVSPGRRIDPSPAMEMEHWRQLLTEYLDAA